jgi:enolase
MPTVTHLEALEILDSRGCPTLEVTCVLDEAVRAKAAVPAFDHRGRYEAVPLHDHEPDRYEGRGCRKAVALCEGEVRSALSGKRYRNQAAFDKALIALDGTSNRGRLGANSLLAISVAFARGQAILRGVPLYRHLAELATLKPALLPRPVISLFSRDEHEPRDRGSLELRLVPVAATSLDQALSVAAAVRRSATALIRDKYQTPPTASSDGGLVAPFFDTESMLNDAVEVVRAAGLVPDEDVELVLAVDASSRHDNGWYRIDRERLLPREVVERYDQWVEHFPLMAIEDGLGDEDWEHWSALRAKLEGRADVVAADLLSASVPRITRAATEKAASTLHLKPGQVATVTEMVEAVAAARAGGLALVVGARGGETEDDWLADMAVGFGAEYLYLGAVTGAERTSKYNRLLAVEKKNRWPLQRSAGPPEP